MFPIITAGHTAAFYRLRRGNPRRAVSAFGRRSRPVRPDQLAERVLYRDGLVLVIDKPAGIPVHQGPGGGPHLEHWFPLLRFGLPRPPALAHRLDRDTSGCLVLGRHPKALRRLGRLFAEGRVEKVYWAVVAGAADASRRDASRPGCAKETRGTGWRMVVDPAGQHAVTDYRVLAAHDGRAWLELRPRTGRTHQVRVHCAALGLSGRRAMPPYGEPRAEMPLQLHARVDRPAALSCETGDRRSPRRCRKHMLARARRASATIPPARQGATAVSAAANRTAPATVRQTPAVTGDRPGERLAEQPARCVQQHGGDRTATTARPVRSTAGR